MRSLPHLTADLRARQLPVIDVDLVTRHGRLHQHERVRGNLMPQSSAPAVDHDANLGAAPVMSEATTPDQPAQIEA